MSLRGLYARQPWLNIRQPDVVGPAVGTDLDMVAASVIAAIDQQSGDGPRHRAVSRTLLRRRIRDRSVHVNRGFDPAGDGILRVGERLLRGVAVRQGPPQYPRIQHEAHCRDRHRPFSRYPLWPRRIVSPGPPPFFQPTGDVMRPLGMFGSSMALAPAPHHRRRHGGRH